MNKRHLLLLGLIVLVSGTLSFFMLTRGHPWWDDFAAYVMQAKAILAWDMDEFVRRNAFTIQQSSYPPGPVAYPWGFPLLLVPVVAIFGVNPLALKLVGVGCYVVFLVVFYFFARTRLDNGEVLLLTSVLALNPSLLLANDLILSDVPFLLFSTLGVLLADRISRSEKSPDFLPEIALGVTIFLAFFTRTNGILLLAPLAVSLLIRFWPHWQDALKRAFIPALSFSFLFLLSIWLFPNGQDSYLSHFSMFTLQRLLDNVLFYLRLPWQTFANLPAGVIFYPILAVFLLVSVFTHLKRDAAIYTYCLLTVFLFIMWPERQGLRFIYPVLPFLFVFAFDGMKRVLARLRARWQVLARRAVTGFWVLLLVLSFGVSANLAYTNMAAKRAINGPFDEYSYDLYEFIRDETPADSVIIFVRPRALRLFTDRDAFMTENCADLPKGDYVAIHEKMGNVGQISPEEVTSCNPSVTLKQVFNNRRFTVYQINP
jgi:4-amino-4-deoxy-L-arabinose transferase-like glycosyltransferase